MVWGTIGTITGFDLDRDGVGDGPYEYFPSYADRIWMDVPARFFKGSPVLEVLDFLERLALFSDPAMVLKDARPMMTAELAQRKRTLRKSKLRIRRVPPLARVRCIAVVATPLQ